MSGKPNARVNQPGSSCNRPIVVELLRPQGVSIAEVVAATSWNAASARSFLSFVIQKRLRLPLVSDKSGEGERRYHIATLETFD